jgi:hypothetical protein
MCSTQRENKKVWHNHYVGSFRSRLCRQALEHLNSLGASIVLLERDNLSFDAAQASTVFVEVPSDHTGRFFMHFPDLPEDGDPSLREQFLTTRKMDPLPEYALHARRLIGLRRPTEGETHRGEACQRFHAELRKLRAEAMAEFTSPPRHRKRTQYPSLGGYIPPPYTVEAP